MMPFVWLMRESNQQYAKDMNRLSRTFTRTAKFWREFRALASRDHGKTYATRDIREAVRRDLDGTGGLSYIKQLELN